MSISAISTSGADNASRLFSRLDTDSSGGISKEEFTAGRPNNVTEDQASTLFDQLDSSGSGSLSTDDLKKMGPPPGGMMSPQMSQSLMGLQDVGSSASDQNVSALDTNGDGMVTEDEFLAAKPDDVTEEQAQTLWDSFDTEGAGELSVDDLQTAMASNRPQGPGGPPPGPPPSDSSSERSDSTDDLSSMISAMDTNGDGVVTQDEFLAARPDDVSENMATNLWNKLDAEGAGELSTDDLQTAMAENAPPPPPSAEASSTSFAQELGSASGFNLSDFQNAINSYDMTALAFGSQNQFTSSMLMA